MQSRRHCRGKTLKKRALPVIALALTVLLCILMIIKADLSQVSLLSSADMLILDPGHGGIDGGAQAADGTPEKDINLDIALRVAQLAKEDGWSVIMTRTADELLGSAEGGIRSKKTADLKERKRIIDETKPLLAVSIHLNSFKQDRSVNGAQVFYPQGTGNDAAAAADPDVADNGASATANPYVESKRLAECIQEALHLGLDDGTVRSALPKKDILIFKEVTVPVVLVECGFLSNPQDVQNLKSADYRQKLSWCIYDGIMAYSKKEIKKNIFLIDSLTAENG